MLDTKGIHDSIQRARRRLRIQAAVDRATLASILASSSIALCVYLVRRELISDGAGVGVAAVAIAVVLGSAIAGLLKAFPTYMVATRIDRASGLADRLSSACAFEEKLATKAAGEVDEETRALMEAAINDAVRILPKADVVRATPFQTPRESRAALAFAAVAAVLAGLYFPAPETAHAIGPKPPMVDREALEKAARAVSLDDEDVDYSRELLDDLRQTAEKTQDPNLKKFVNDVEELLNKAQEGELSKAELLDKLSEAEKKFMEGSNENIEESMSDLKETGKELKKDKLTKELGKALEQGNLEQAQKEMEKLAESLENNKLSDKDKKKLAKALEMAADKFEKEEKKKEDKQEQELAERKKRIERLQKRRDEEKDPEKRERLTKRIDEEKRELKRLQRDKQEKKQSQQRRALKELHRNMKQAAKNMQQQPKNGEQKQEQQKLAARSLRSAAKNTGSVDKDRRKVANQKKVASQLSDLREALRRAKRRGSQGPRDMFGKNKRNQDFRNRARGRKGSRSAWKPGQGQGKGQGQQGQGKGQGQGQQGQGQGGKQWGEGHDPDMLGDPTAKAGNTSDESLQGVQGKGQSTRETILSSAQKGFSTRAYRDVYARYKNIVEEVIRAEKVPSGYKYYVKRYFQKIKPHSMD